MDTTQEPEVIGSEFLLNRARMINRRKGLITRTVVQNPDGSFDVTWMKQPPNVSLVNSVNSHPPHDRRQLARYKDPTAIRNTFSPGCKV